MRVILASASPRRSQLMKCTGIDFEVRTSEVEEVITGHLPEEVVKELSMQKAEDVFESVLKEKACAKAGEKDREEEFVVIGADTVVSVDGKILGKPKDEEEAFGMIRSLSGRGHEVYTGVTLIRGNHCQRKKVVFAEQTEVFFQEITNEEIREYLKEESWKDKAGAYGIQENFGAKYIREIRGDYYNVVGLPVSRVYKELRSF